MDLMFAGVNWAPYIEGAKIAGPVIVVAGTGLAYGRRLVDRILNREFDQWMISYTSIERLPDGRYALILDNLGSPRRFDDEVRGRDERKAMTHAAKRCTWDLQGRFILGNDSEETEGIFHVTRNALTHYWQDGVRAKMAGKEPSAYTYFFAITGADAAVGVKKKYRIIMMTARDMKLLLELGDESFVLQDETHAVRLETCRLMARAWHENGAVENWWEQTNQYASGYIDCGGRKQPLVGWLRAYELA